MSASAHIPVALKGKTTEALIASIGKFQAEQGGKCHILTIYWDPGESVHVCWIYTLRNLGGVVVGV